MYMCVYIYIHVKGYIRIARICRGSYVRRGLLGLRV